MSAWVKRITSLLHKKKHHAPLEAVLANNIVTQADKLDAIVSTAGTISNTNYRDAVLSRHYNQEEASQTGKCEQDNSVEEGAMADLDESDKSGKFREEDSDNLKALEKLRAMPRGSGSSADSRIAAIKNLLGEKEIFRTLQKLRWPKGIVCPRCHSSQVVRRDPPPHAPDKRHYYECLTCKGEGDPSDFDDFTGLPVGTIQGLRQWMLCWYLIGFCSLSQIARVLGLSLDQVARIASYGAHITEIAPEGSLKDALKAKEQRLGDKKKLDKELSRKAVDGQEENTRREGLQPFKPGFKSKK